MSKDLTWPTDRMSKFIDITPRRLQQLVQEGVLPKSDRGRYNPFIVTVAYIRYLRDRVPLTDQSESDYQSARLAKIRSERELIDLEVSIKKGIRIPLEMIESVNEQAHQAIAAIIKSNRDKTLSEKVINEIFQELREIPVRLKHGSNGNGTH